MPGTLTPEDRLRLADWRHRKLLRLTVALGLLAGLCLLSNVVSVMGAERGAIGWPFTLVMLGLLGASMAFAQAARQARDQASLATLAEVPHDGTAVQEHQP